MRGVMTQTAFPTALAPPPEWAPHAAIWTAWPTNADEWAGQHLNAAKEIAAMIRALAAPGKNGRQGDDVRVLVQGEAIAAAREAVGDVATLVEADYGDVWLRDTGPIFIGRDHAAGFQWNGWGGKYLIDNDDKVADQIATATGAQLIRHGFVLEGGAIDGDGQGNWLTTRQCLLNPNRNPHWSTEADAETALRESLGARNVIWLGDGLLNDHTDGHVDNVARFVAPGIALCQSPFGDDDPNKDVLNEIHENLCAAVLASGANLQVLQIPSPGLITDDQGVPVPASHMNFIIGNAAIVLPIYCSETAPNVIETVRVLSAVFPNRKIVPLRADALLTGGGSFHCITQQQPAISKTGDQT